MTKEFVLGMTLNCPTLLKIQGGLLLDNINVSTDRWISFFYFYLYIKQGGNYEKR